MTENFNLCLQGRGRHSHSPWHHMWNSLFFPAMHEECSVPFFCGNWALQPHYLILASVPGEPSTSLSPFPTELWNFIPFLVQRDLNIVSEHDYTYVFSTLKYFICHLYEFGEGWVTLWPGRKSISTSFSLFPLIPTITLWRYSHYLQFSSENTKAQIDEAICQSHSPSKQ